MDKTNKKNQEENHEQAEKQQEQLIEQATEQTKIEDLEKSVTELDTKYKRALADYQNLEKWMREQRSEWVRQANKDLLLRLLPILDTLLLAKQHSEDKTLQVSIGQFLDILKSEGVTKIDTKDKEFDPHLMEAITTAAGKENKVVSEIRSGYLLHDKVLRPAQVVVGAGEEK